MEGFFVIILIIIISLVNKSSKQNKRKQAYNAVQNRQRAGQLPQTPPKRVGKKPTPVKAAAPMPSLTDGPEADLTAVPEPLTQAAADEEPERDGSIDMPAPEAHEHEGKPMPCPAEEREAPRPRPAQLAPQRQEAEQPGFALNFSKNTLVQAAVMAEILKRPEFKNGRRVIR